MCILQQQKPQQQEQEGLDEWKEAVLNELIVCHMYQKVHESQPRVAIRDAIQWNVEVALDPRVSEDAILLMDAVRKYGSTHSNTEIYDLLHPIMIDFRQQQGREYGS